MTYPISGYSLAIGDNPWLNPFFPHLDFTAKRPLSITSKRSFGRTVPFARIAAATGDKIGRLNGKTTRPGLRKCYACRKPFTVRMGTIFEDSHLPLRLWLQAIHLMCASKKGIAPASFSGRLVAA